MILHLHRLKKAYEDTFTGITIEAGKEETGEIAKEELKKENIKEPVRRMKEEIDDFDDSFIAPSKHKYKSTDQSYEEHKNLYNKKKADQEELFYDCGNYSCITYYCSYFYTVN